jgi:hypothetical protein
MTRPWISEEQDRKAIEQWKRRHDITSLLYLMEYDALGELGRKELGAIIRHFFYRHREGREKTLGHRSQKARRPRSWQRPSVGTWI